MDDNSTGVFNPNSRSVALPAVLGDNLPLRGLQKNKARSTASSAQQNWRKDEQPNHFDSIVGEPEWTTNLERLIALYRDKCSQRILVHREAANYYNRRLKMFSVPSAILGAIGTSTVFVTWKSESCTESWHEITLLASGVCMLLSTALSALVAQSQYQALFAAHLKSYRNFDKMLKKLTVELCFERHYRQNVREFIDTMLREYDHLVDEAELVPNSVERKIRRSLIDATVRLNEVDQDEERDREDALSRIEDGQSSETVDCEVDDETHALRDSSGNENPGSQSSKTQSDSNARKRMLNIMRKTNFSDAERYAFFHRELHRLEKQMAEQKSKKSHSGGLSTRQDDTDTDNSPRSQKPNSSSPTEKQRSHKLSMSSRKYQTLPSRRANNISSASSFVYERMPLTSMVDWDAIVPSAMPAGSFEEEERKQESLSVRANRRKTRPKKIVSFPSKNRMHKIFEQKKVFNNKNHDAPSVEDTNKTLSTNNIAFAQTKTLVDNSDRRNTHEESHQTLVASVTAQGIDNLAKSYDRSPSSSPSSTPLSVLSSSSLPVDHSSRDNSDDAEKTQSIDTSAKTSDDESELRTGIDVKSGKCSDTQTNAESSPGAKKSEELPLKNSKSKKKEQKPGKKVCFNESK